MRRSTRIIYVEHDPAAAAYARIAHDIDDRTAVCEADFADLDTVFASGAVQLLDQDRPVVATLTRTLHRLPPNTDHAAYLADLVRRLPSGSYVVVCHFTCADPSLGRQINALMSTATNGTWGHVATPGCMREWFKGLQLIDDRLERADQAWTDTPPATLSAPALTGHSAVVWVP